jgi:putative acetyltransferase
MTDAKTKAALKRQFGRLKGLVKIGPEFFEPLPEEVLKLWNGEDDVVVRPCTTEDDGAITRINDVAFGTPGEARLIQALRGAGAAAIELVAVEGADVVGHILFSVLDATVDDRPVKALALAPMAVEPTHQRRGIGSALIRAGLDRARHDGWEAVIVLGHPRYYPRLGFSAAQARHLSAPYAGEAFMALALRSGALDGSNGRVVYPAPFALVD